MNLKTLKREAYGELNYKRKLSYIMPAVLKIYIPLLPTNKLV